MLLDNRMEDKQLNLDQPFLSVRRHSSTAVPEKDERKKTKNFLPGIPRPPPYKSMLKSGPVKHPGAVPFVWEQSPGMPKDENKLQTSSPYNRPPTIPKLPPGWLHKASQQDFDKTLLSPTANKSQVRNDHESKSIPAQDEQSNGFECFEDAMEEDGASQSGDGEEVFVDARDTLSRTESFFLDCSARGISGFEDPEVEASGTISVDPQTRDFMIGRFLPAAKAMVSENHPQYAPKKQPIVQEQPRPLKKVINGDNRPQLRYGPSFIKHYSQSLENREEESDDDYDENEDLPMKVCGLLPCFCLKGGSFGLLKPVPGMSVRTRVSISPVNRGHTRSSSASSLSKTENQLSSFDVSEQRSMDGSQTTELHEEKIDLDKKLRQTASNITKLEGPYLHKHFQNSGMSSCVTESSLSLEHSTGFGSSKDENISTGLDDSRSHVKGYKSFKELLADPNSPEEMNDGNPAVEKTLYIDTVHEVQSPREKSCPSHSKRMSSRRGKDTEILAQQAKENLSVDPLVLEKLISNAEGDKLKVNFQKPDFKHISLADELNPKIGKETAKTSGLDQSLYQDLTHPEILEVPDKGLTQTVGKHSLKSHAINSGFLIPPPLPKSPSDSWLCRTLPSMSSKNLSLNSHSGTTLNPRTQASKTQSSDAKWETMVKTTSGLLHHVRYSQESLLAIPENY